MGPVQPLSPAISRRMQRQRRAGTAPEVALRRGLWRLGFRYRVDLAVVGRRRRVDIAFTRRKVAVFVDGCFWHRCPLHGSLPKNNAEWWAAKLQANVDRDRDTDSILRTSGWTVIRVWEHESTDDAVQRVVQVLTYPAVSSIESRGAKVDALLCHTDEASLPSGQHSR